MNDLFKKLITKINEIDNFEHLNNIRVKFIKRFFLIGLSIGLFSIIFTSIDYIINGRYLEILLFILVYVICILIVWTNIFSTNILRKIAVFVFVLFGTIVTLQDGFFSSGLVWVSAIPIIAILIVNVRWALYSLAFLLFFLFISIILFEFEIVVWDFGFEYYNTYRWAATIIDSIIISSIIVFSMILIMDNVRKAVQNYELKIANYQNEIIDKNIKISEYNDKIELYKQNEGKLKTYNIRSNAAQNHGNVGLWEYNIENKMFWLSNKSIEMLSLNINENIISLDNILNIFDSEKDKNLFENLFKKSNYNNNYLLEFNVSNENKNICWIKLKGEKSSYNSSNRNIIYGSFVDITNDKLYKDEIVKSELWFKNIIENALDGIAIIKDYKFIQINNSIQNLFKESKENILNRNFWDFAPDMQSDLKSSELKVKYFIDKTISEGDYTFEWEILDSLKNTIKIEVDFQLFEYDNNNYIISFLKDITERKNQEQDIIKVNSMLETKVNERTTQLNQAMEELKYENEERKRTQDELYKLQDELVASLSKARELSDIKSRFIEMASHEYRTPLTAILSALYLIEVFYEKRDNQNFNKNIEIIKNAVNNMTFLLEDIFEVEKSDKSKYDPKISQIEFLSFLHSLADETKSRLNFGGKIILNSEAKDMLIISDASALRSIFSRLLNNSIKFTISNKPILISVDDFGDNIRIIIKDEGIGIVKEDLDKIFEMFYKSSNQLNYDIKSGIGLGLNIVRNNLDNIGGKISINSSPNEGTEVTVFIPKYS